MASKGGTMDLIDILQKEADLTVYGPKIDQCPICGGPTGQIPWQTKEGLFEQMYGYHMDCSRKAQTPHYARFMVEWDKIKDTKAKKEGAEAASGTQGERTADAVRKRLQEIAAGNVDPLAEEIAAPAAAPPAPVPPAPVAEPQAPAAPATPEEAPTTEPPAES